MKPNLRVFLTVLAVSVGAHTAAAQGTAFTYQGRLAFGTNPANGTFDLTFGLFSVAGGPGQVGATITNSAVGVTNGLFTTALDFGANFPGADRWLEIGVRTNGIGAFATLSPRQKVTPAPYAITAGNVEPGGGLAGTYSSAVTFSNLANRFTGDGSGLTGVNATTLCGVPCTNFWQLGGNTGTTGANYLGTADNHSLEFRVNGSRAGLLLPFPNGSPSVQWGTVNGVSLTGNGGNVIGGGGYIGAPNLIFTDFSVIGGGYNNQIYPSCPESVIGGGQGNFIYGSTAVIGGGAFNTNSGLGATIPGGLNNVAGGNYAFAAGNSAQAAHSGAFVWADNSGGAFASTTDNQFNARALGGVRFVTGGAGMTIDGLPVSTGGGSGWSLAGNSATGANFLGTTNNQALEFRANGSRAGLLLPFPNGSPSMQWGTVNGVSSTGNGGNVIGGGGYIGAPNLIFTDFSVIGGGYNNQIYPSCPESVIGGGQGNFIYGSTAVIGGGAFNTNSGGVGCTIPGGLNNVAGGNYAFAAGYYAHATNSGAFVWSDGTGVTTSSTTDNSVTFRASGGYRLFTDIGTSGVQLAPGGGSWTTLSDRNAKQDFEPVNARAVLDTLAALPVSTWSYKSQDASVRHIGPMAQDFKAAFAVGESDTGITTVDADGVALAAIKGLNEKLEASVRAKETEIQALQQRLERLEKMVPGSSNQP